MKKRALIVLVLAGVALIAGAQDWSASPTYGSVELSSGFLPDPYTVQLTAGGSVDLSGIGYYGYVASAPDFDLYYEAGSFDLTIRVQNSGGDTVLLVNDPSGTWHFNDDSNGLDPAITFSKPQSGLYDIWVGTFGDSFIDATLAITEME